MARQYSHVKFDFRIMMNSYISQTFTEFPKIDANYIFICLFVAARNCSQIVRTGLYIAVFLITFVCFILSRSLTKLERR